MTQQPDVARGRDIVARWCALAEQRLEYLTELSETGRWRRYHSELAFLENIQEAKTAVQIWRDLSMREASRDNSAIDMSWLGYGRIVPPRSDKLRDQVRRPPPQLTEIQAEPPPSVISIVPEADFSSDDTPSAAAMDDASTLTQDIAAAIAERYPLLRNAL
jgi:uncharacterized repeat protein (TIGR03809 family)